MRMVKCHMMTLCEDIAAVTDRNPIICMMCQANGLNPIYIYSSLKRKYGTDPFRQCFPS